MLFYNSKDIQGVVVKELKKYHNMTNAYRISVVYYNSLLFCDNI
jgi:hypothetical protein